MKTIIVLLAAVAFAYGFPPPNLRAIIKEARMLTQEMEGCEYVFVKDLKNGTDSCGAMFFCEAEKVLSEAKLNTVTCNHSIDKLLRNLNVYNNKTNCTLPTKGNEIMLRSFFENLTKCAKNVYSKMPHT